MTNLKNASIYYIEVFSTATLSDNSPFENLSEYIIYLKNGKIYSEEYYCTPSDRNVEIYYLLKNKERSIKQYIESFNKDKDRIASYFNSIDMNITKIGQL